MTQSHPVKTFDNQTCLCCMCRCGDHKCFQQLASTLPIWMQNELKFDEDRTTCTKKAAFQADPHPKTTYKRDFCEQQDIVDCYPLEQERPVENLKPFSKYGYVTKSSQYGDDFIPWSRDEQKLCRGKLHVPDHVLNRDADDGFGDALEPTREDQLYSYYCPAHCVGEQKPVQLENCLIGHKDRFNLGPPAKRKNIIIEKSGKPFEKFSNYMLDYKGGKISPESKVGQRGPDITTPPCPMSSDTSYRSAFTCPPKMDSKPTKRGAQPDTLAVGEGPMTQQTTSMLDYKDPVVAVHKPFRPPRDAFQPPPCSMETNTTTGSAFLKWEGTFSQEKPKKEKHRGSYIQPERDVRRLVTTYQEDFDGLNSALCPCRVVEKYGPKVLEPRYSYRESEKLHDFFLCSKEVSESTGNECPH